MRHPASSGSLRNLIGQKSRRHRNLSYGPHIMIRRTHTATQSRNQLAGVHGECDEVCGFQVYISCVMLGLYLRLIPPANLKCRYVGRAYVWVTCGVFLLFYIKNVPLRSRMPGKNQWRCTSQMQISPCLWIYNHGVMRSLRPDNACVWHRQGINQFWQIIQIRCNSVSHPMQQELCEQSLASPVPSSRARQQSSSRPSSY